MEFNSILDLDKVPEREDGRPAFFLDLNLNQIIERICALWEKDVASYYYYLPLNKVSEDYRRAVFEDVKRGGTYDILCDFVKEMAVWMDACDKAQAVRSNLQRSVWFITEVNIYCEAFAGLHAKLQTLELQSDGMCAFREYLGTYLQSGALRELWDMARQLQGSMDAFRFQIVYENERMSVVMYHQAQNVGKVETGVLENETLKKKSQNMALQGGELGSYDQFLRTAFPGRQHSMRTPFEITPDNSELEQEILKIIRKLQPEFFRKTKRFYEMFSEYADDTLLQFWKEIQFYLSFRRFELGMGEQGYAFSMPKCAEASEMQAVALYDLALACAKGNPQMDGGDNERNCSDVDKVVANDMAYLPGERFFVLTGPNQGGKTTFARSLGQMVYFTKLGLDVPAKSACVPYFTDMLTHFSVEESVETGRGKLKEELVRLEPMMDKNCENAFVIINELFTTAANYDACIMGKRVLAHFLNQKCCGIYVTHLKELAEETPGIVSLRAMLDESGRQNFEIRRSPAVESANASNQVNKYRLTYEQLRERLK